VRESRTHRSTRRELETGHGLGIAAPAKKCMDSAGSTRPLRQLSTLLMSGGWRRSRGRGTAAPAAECVDSAGPAGHRASPRLYSRLRRRELLLGVGASAAGVMALTACDAVPGRAPRKPPLIGYINNTFANDPAQPVNTNALREGLREQGLVEGTHILIEWRWAEGQNERVPLLLSELLNLGERVIVTTGSSAIPARQW
jgi:hypothetical protein